jgi:hypothetical protein
MQCAVWYNKSVTKQTGRVKMGADGSGKRIGIGVFFGYGAAA